ncbi:MAG: GNAT family N-acetyltransferase [Bacillota bacterium]
MPVGHISGSAKFDLKLPIQLGQYTLRLARPGEAESISNLINRAFNDYCQQGINSALAENLKDVKLDIEENLVLVLVGNTGLAGTLRLVLQEESIYLKRFAIAPDCQGQGLGSQLFKAVRELVAETDKGYIYLYSSLEKEKLVAFYEKLGFSCHRVDQKKGYRRGLWIYRLQEEIDKGEEAV